MSNKSEARCSKQAGVVTTLRCRDLYLLRGRAYRAFVNFLLHVSSKQTPAINRAAGDHDDLGIDDVDEIREANAEVSAELLEDAQGECVARAPRIVNHFRRQLATM